MNQFWHNLTSWNSIGEGVHSPYLFNLVHFELESSGRFYAWEELQPDRRERVLYRLINSLHHEGIDHVDVPDERTRALVRAVGTDIRMSHIKGTQVHVHMRDKNKDVLILPEGEPLPENWTSVFDYGAMKLIFFDPCYYKRTYKMRL